MNPSFRWLGLALLILAFIPAGRTSAATCGAASSNECTSKQVGDACTVSRRGGKCGFLDPDDEKALTCSCVEPEWTVSIELGAQGSTFNSSRLAVNEENPNLFEDTDPFVGVVGSVPVIKDTTNLLWGIRFGSVDAEFDPNPNDPGQGTQLLNDAESVYMAMELQHRFGKHFYIAGRLSGYSPTEDSDDLETRASFLGEHAFFGGIVNRQEDARLRNSRVQFGYGRSERFLERNDRKFVEVRVDYDVTKATSFIVDLRAILASGADDLRVAFGFQSTLSSFFE